MESDFCCFGDLFELFLHFWARENSGLCQNRFFHNDLTRRTDPRPPEGPWIFFTTEVDFVILHFSILGPGTRALAVDAMVDREFFIGFLIFCDPEPSQIAT